MSDHQRSSMGTTPLCGTCDNTYYPCPTRILTDLIAELRDTAAVYPGATGRLLMEIAGSAEARLREVQGE